MADIFTPVIQKLAGYGFLNFLIFIVTFAIFFALIKKSKIFGESQPINLVVSFSAAFLIFSFPVLMGINLATPLSTFFTQGFVILLFFIFGMIAASVFYPDLPGMLAKEFTRRTTFWSMVAIGVALFVTSGLIDVFTSMQTKPSTTGAPKPPVDVVTIIAGLIIFVVVLMIASSAAKGGM
jgi:predicted cobalt transporter CbtA